MLGFVPDKSTKRNRTNSTPEQGKFGNRAGQTALQRLGAGHASQFLSVSLGCLQMICYVTFDKSSRIPGLNSPVPFTFVRILLMQNGHEAPSGFGGGGTDTEALINLSWTYPSCSK